MAVCLFLCECGGAKDENRWTILEVFNDSWLVVGCSGCLALGRRNRRKCFSLEVDRGEYEAALLAAVRRTERIARQRRRLVDGPRRKHGA